LKKRETPLIRGRRNWTGAVVLQAVESVAFKGVEQPIDMGPSQRETGGNTLFVPALRGHPDHAPARLVGVVIGGKGRQIAFELSGGLIGVSKPLERGMIGLEAKFTEHNAHTLASVDGGIALLHVDDRPRNGFGIEGFLRLSGLGAPISEACHALQNDPPGCVAHGRALHPRLTPALSGRFAKEDNRSNDLVIMLVGIDTLQPNLLKILLSRHKKAPCRVSTGQMIAI
jgi:hypothetical protein